MSLRDIIAKKIRSAIVEDFDNIQFKPKTIYIRELPASKLKYGYLTQMECVVVDDKEDSNLYEKIIKEIGTFGEYGEYYVYNIDYSYESPVKALDGVWTRRLILKITWEE